MERRKLPPGVVESDVKSPFDKVQERLHANPFNCFAPENLDALVVLWREDRPGYERLRSTLRKAGVRLTELDRAVRAAAGEARKTPSQSDLLIASALAEGSELFHAPDGTAYADVFVDGRRETWPVLSSGMRAFLIGRFYRDTGGAPSRDALQSALDALAAGATLEGEECVVGLRVATLDQGIYVDLADSKWRAIEVGEDGWAIVDTPRMRFRRSPGMLPLPVPRRGGSIDLLRRFLNVASEDDFVLLVAWMLAALRGEGPYPLLIITGEQGSAKSTGTKSIRALIDPHHVPLRSMPKDDQAAFIAAKNSHVQAIDNVSSIPPHQSDVLCRLSTGGGITIRTLYSNDEETYFQACRPIISNGIGDYASRPDLVDRAVVVELQPIADEDRRAEADFWREYDEARPLILGALLDLLSAALRNKPDVHLDRRSRMADFVEWSVAAFWGTPRADLFLEAYGSNRENAADIALNDVGEAIRRLMEDRPRWHSTPAALLRHLEDDARARAPTWPKDARGLTNAIRRAGPVMRGFGIAYRVEKEGRGNDRKLMITLERSNATLVQFPSPPKRKTYTAAELRAKRRENFAQLKHPTVLPEAAE